ncbi:uncharacterized protein LOC130827277 [Amaranthus tricolor]|uniref:uncharacterized protein LOC130827277 n=1 Tax=Amaranthus tricolor TaxID=29722 RepID=UPI00258B76CC|nr:uncharacterized protein LOC130827277 [Amaranthus tricolor]
MFGRIRASPSPVECLELERLPSKIYKDDSLSIYEATLMKLKKGSQRCLSSEDTLSPVSQDSMDVESNSNAFQYSSKVPGLCSELGLPDCSSNSSCASVPVRPNQEQKRIGENSIHHLFSKYAIAHQKTRCN